jgi:cephalosporin hydroxylase
MTPFEREVQDRIASNAEDETLKDSAQAFVRPSITSKYSYNFFWLGRPVIQYPQDIVAMQEIIWSVKPDLIIETGIAHGGSLIFSASMLELNAACGGQQDAEVLGVDIDIRAHNRKAIEEHPMFKRISMIEGSSIAPEIIEQVTAAAARKQRVLVCLDSNHTRDHVLAELEAYAPLASLGSYCVVFDTIIEDLSAEMCPDRPWGPGNNPKTAVWEYLRRLNEEGRKASDGTRLFYEADRTIESKLLITAAPDGYLRRIEQPII